METELKSVRRLGDGQVLCEQCLREEGLADEAEKVFGWDYGICTRCQKQEMETNDE